MPYGWLPSVTDVELYVPQRVTDATGHFSTTSAPTSDEVTSLIALAAEDVYAAAGDVTTRRPDLLNAARNVTALGTALLIEQGYTSNEAEEKSPRLDDLRKQYEAALGRLTKAAQDAAGEVVPDAAYGFPDLTSTDEAPFGQFVGGMTWSTDF